MRSDVKVFRMRIMAIGAGLLMCLTLSAQNEQEVNWWKSQKIFVGGGFGLGWSEKADPHMQYTLSVANGPATGPYDSKMQSSFFSFSGSLSYYPAKYFSLHIKGGQQMHNLEEITDQDGQMHMRYILLQTKLNVFQTVRKAGTVQNVYVGGGIGSYGFNFWKEDGNVKTEVDFKSAIGTNIVAGVEWMFMGNTAEKMNILFFLEFNADIATFEFESANTNGHTSTTSNIPYDDWRQVKANAYGAEMGLRFSLFNKKLPMVYK